jgi:hypothetical protein
MPQQVAHLGQRNALLDQARGVLVPEVVPVEVDRAERLEAPGRRLTAVPAPTRAAGLQIY